VNCDTLEAGNFSVLFVRMYYELETPTGRLLFILVSIKQGQVWNYRGRTFSFA
jgi:hypothetical protein